MSVRSWRKSTCKSPACWIWYYSTRKSLHKLPSVTGHCCKPSSHGEGRGNVYSPVLLSHTCPHPVNQQRDCSSTWPQYNSLGRASCSMLNPGFGPFSNGMSASSNSPAQPQMLSYKRRMFKISRSPGGILILGRTGIFNPPRKLPGVVCTGSSHNQVSTSSSVLYRRIKNPFPSCHGLYCLD